MNVMMNGEMKLNTDLHHFRERRPGSYRGQVPPGMSGKQGKFGLHLKLCVTILDLSYRFGASIAQWIDSTYNVKNLLNIYHCDSLPPLLILLFNVIVANGRT